MIGEMVLCVSAILAISGALALWYEKNLYQKLIALSIIIGGFMPLLIFSGYLDVAILVALIGPISTIIFVLAISHEEQR